MPWPKLEETAILTVNGRDYRDWESVMVRHGMRDSPIAGRLAGWR